MLTGASWRDLESFGISGFSKGSNPVVCRLKSPTVVSPGHDPGSGSQLPCRRHSGTCVS